MSAGQEIGENLRVEAVLGAPEGTWMKAGGF